MGFVGCIPLFNWMAWVFGALDSDNPRFYGLCAALYALPLLRTGFDQDWFSWSLLITGAVHLQLLRIAATEPDTQAMLAEQLAPLKVLKTAASAAGSAVTALTGIGTRGNSPAGQLPPGGQRSWSGWVEDNTEDGKAADDGQADNSDLADEMERRELQQFDAQLRARERERQQREKQT